MTNKEHAAGQEVKTSPGETASGPVSAASPLDYPGLPADLRRQIREERRELVEALRGLLDADTDLQYHGEPFHSYCPICVQVAKARAILAREGGKS